jgi:uncharacterized protein (TIGR03083 family)
MMSLETVEDARRVRRISRAEYDDLLRYLEQLPLDDWTEQSACDDWQVYQVASHIASGQKINRARFETGLRGAPPLTDDQRQAIWDHYDGLKPNEMLDAFREGNDEYFELVDSLGDDDLGRTIEWFVGPVPVAVALALRLNEQALHAWDIRWARDKQAKLFPAGVPDLLENVLTPRSLGGLVQPERAERLQGKTIQFVLSQPSGAVAIELRPDGVRGSQGRSDAAELTAELSSEAFIRLLWGRYDVRAGLDSGQLRLSEPALAEELQALFPGR